MAQIVSYLIQKPSLHHHYHSEGANQFFHSYKYLQQFFADDVYLTTHVVKKEAGKGECIKPPPPF
jgi:hypothetical protein